jgi:hypothetical protein
VHGTPHPLDTKDLAPFFSRESELGLEWPIYNLSDIIPTGGTINAGNHIPDCKSIRRAVFFKLKINT